VLADRLLVKVGLLLSIIVTVWVAVLVRPAALVAVYVIVVTPTGKTLPAGTPVLCTVNPGQLSVAEAEPRSASDTNTVQDEGLFVLVTATGGVMLGPWVGYTNKLADPEVPL
jgi:hypothetical protein